ncbi:uncharacterized protein LOC100210627 isoform X1 [Hydra vulgaris]|uniref:Uncharacterized protein LOC100210627 isoform X1 n=1 Tax=Hydra vulgaris TaxID=6087 RepID=A0ABM4D367_HYDVU
MKLRNIFLLLTLFVVHIRADEEERDPWDKSTDKYWKNGSNNDSSNQTNMDVTEETDSEVHTVKSSVAKGESENVNKKNVEKTPAVDGTIKNIKKKSKKKKSLTKKSSFNNQGNFYPGSIWEYPYPYYHPQYATILSAVMSPCACKQETELGALDVTNQLESENSAKPLVIKDKSKHLKSKTAKRQRLQNLPYYYSTTGWGGLPNYNPLIEKNAPIVIWVPYKKKSSIYATRQLVPSHYYGPPSAGWGGFQPGYTGGGWGVPYWYKKSNPLHHVRQLVPSHYYGPPSAGWGGFQPGHTGGGWGVPYWYKSNVERPEKQSKKKKSLKHVRASRKFLVANGYAPFLSNNLHGFQNEIQTPLYNGRLQNFGPIDNLNYPTMRATNEINNIELFNNPHSLQQMNAYSDDMRNLLAYQPNRIISGSINGLLPKQNSILTEEKNYPNEFVLNNFAHNNLLSHENLVHSPSNPANSLDFSIWHGPNSLGGSGWVGNGWVGNHIGLNALHKIIPGHGIGIPIIPNDRPLENIRQ